MEIKFDVYFKKNLGTLFKSNEVDLNGKHAHVNIPLALVDKMEINYLINGNKKYTDDVLITDITENLIQIPFKSDVVKVGLNEFEIIAYMKNGDIKTSQTYTYNIEEGIGEGQQVSNENSSSDGHTHSNLNVLNSITQTKINEWNNKANKEHTHGDYAEKNHTHNVSEIEGLDNMDIDLSNYYTKNETYTKSQTDNKIVEEIAKAQIGGSGEVDLSAYATKNYVDDEISKIVLGSGNIVFRDALVNEVFELEKASDNPNESVSVESISLNFNNYTLKAGETIQLIETVLPYNATNKSVVWNSSNLNATVVNGLVTANMEGVCTITCSTVDGNKSATCNIIINEATTEDTNANLLLWLDGKDVGEVSGIWKDKSGNGNDMTLFNTDNLIISDGMVQFSGTVGGGMESYGYSSIDLIDKSFTVLLEGVFPNSFKCGGTHSQTIYLNVMPKKMAIFRKGKSFEPDYANVFNGIDPHKIVISHNKDTKECLVFVDNVQVASGTLDSMCSSICRFGLGSNYGGGTYYKMGVSQLKIYDTVINV